MTFLGGIETKLKNTHSFAKPYRGDVNPLNLVCYLLEIGSIIRNLDDIFLQIIKTLNVFFMFSPKKYQNSYPKETTTWSHEMKFIFVVWKKFHFSSALIRKTFPTKEGYFCISKKSCKVNTTEIQTKHSKKKGLKASTASFEENV